MELEPLFEKYKLQIGIGAVGLVLLGLGVFFLRFDQETPKVEIISEETAPPGNIFVDLQGAVQNPGVFELPVNSRINDLLVQAGGLSAEADRDWLNKNINLAQKLSDGVKIYIPTQKEVRQFGGPALSTGGEVAGAAGVVVAGKININTASAAQLDTLWGIGEKRAADIIANRPYQSIEELLTKAKIPKNVFEKIKEKVTVY